MRFYRFIGTLLLAYMAIAVHAQDRLDSLLKINVKTKTPEQRFHVFIHTSTAYKQMGDYAHAKDYLDCASDILRKIKKNELKIELNMGYAQLFEAQAKYGSSIKSYFICLRLARKAKDKSSEAQILDQIGVVYWYENETDKALGYLEQSLHISEEDGDLTAMSGTMNNLGIIYRGKQDFEKALEYYTKAADLFQKLKNRTGYGNVMNNIGIIYQVQADFDKALEYYNKSLEIRKSLDDKVGISTTLGNVGTMYMAQRDYKKAEPFILEALKISDMVDDKEGIKENTYNLSEMYEKQGDGIKALEYYKRYTEVSKKLDQATAEKESYEQELTYKYEAEKLKRKKEQEKKNIQIKAEQKKQQTIIYAVVSVLFIVVIFSFFLLQRFRVTQKQKRLIELQKKEVEIKNREIIDSITYAKRLQEAILPPLSLYQKCFPDSFILYKPKDIVAGDFYFLEEEGGYIIFGAADCTGHGVPGAMVSVVCSNALHRTIKEFKIIDPGAILDKVRELVLKTFEKSGTEVKDGMDISLCVYDKKTGKIKWAGANNPLWILKSADSEKPLREIKPDKQPIGYMQGSKPFTTHEPEVEKGDMIYMFTDGYPDQFGGPAGRKFMYKNFQRKIESIVKLGMKEQQNELEITFEKWVKREGAADVVKQMEQTDDVCILGLRII
jgi:tetratricopeptide (TPR) repeat protein